MTGHGHGADIDWRSVWGLGAAAAQNYQNRHRRLDMPKVYREDSFCERVGRGWWNWMRQISIPSIEESSSRTMRVFRVYSEQRDP